MHATTAILCVGEVVKQRPARSRVFEQLYIDYCCGDRLPLEDACAKRGLEVEQVLKQLQAYDTRELVPSGAYTDADAMVLAELTDHIEQTYHAYRRDELPRLGAMIRKIAAVHGDRHPWMREVNSVFSGFAGELESHMLKEEQVLFPWIRSLETGETRTGLACGRGIATPIRAMEHEHDDAGDALQRMRDLSDNFTPPEDACNMVRAMLDDLAQLECDMHLHVHKENNVLFPKSIQYEAKQHDEADSIK